MYKSYNVYKSYNLLKYFFALNNEQSMAKMDKSKHVYYVTYNFFCNNSLVSVTGHHLHLYWYWHAIAQESETAVMLKSHQWQNELKIHIQCLIKVEKPSAIYKNKTKLLSFA